VIFWRRIARIERHLVRIECKLDIISSQLTRLGGRIMADLTALTAEVARNTDVDTSAIALLEGLAAQIEQLKTDPAALQALADQLKGSSDSLAAAIVANTPAAPTP
jgi:cell division protein FtsB